MFYLLSGWSLSKRATGTERITFLIERKFTIAATEWFGDVWVTENKPLFKCCEWSFKQNDSPADSGSLCRQTEIVSGTLKSGNAAKLRGAVMAIWKNLSPVVHLSIIIILKASKCIKWGKIGKILYSHCRHLILNVNVKYKLSINTLNINKIDTFNDISKLNTINCALKENYLTIIFSL